MSAAIAIVGIACRYPDAASPTELWDNTLSGRRAFRRLPAERVRLEDYLSDDPRKPDGIYATEAAVIDGWEFDRLRYEVAGSTHRSADLAHWLALDTAALALADGGWPAGYGLPKETTGVILGNTLTGEFSRASTLRLRWPFVRRMVEATLVDHGLHPDQGAMLDTLEARYKAPFPPMDEETLAGSLSNTIAGRICNHFDLGGGGYTVDAACASSLLAVCTAANALTSGDLDVVLAGGVDVSLDPFELVGFARAGALAREEMMVYDIRASGFWPGEGCGIAALMRLDDALAQGRRVYAVLRGWGVSSDGSGGITRPEPHGQLRALRRAYLKAGFGIDTLGYIEGHGTGTAVGDAAELQALSRALREAGAHGVPTVIGSIKAYIGHTKAAAGIAGLINATMAVHTQVVPPMSDCEMARPELTGDRAVLRIARCAEAWPVGRPLRAAVNAMGFGGINTHVALEGIGGIRRARLTTREARLAASAQDSELFLLSAISSGALHEQVARLHAFAARLSRAELGDLAAQLARTLEPCLHRAAVLASTPAQLAQRLGTVRGWIAQNKAASTDINQGVFLGKGSSAPRVGLLFPGQGSPVHLAGGAWQRRFDLVREIYTWADLTHGDEKDTSIAQPAIATASIAGMAVLRSFGIVGSIAAGHSLGELAALCWARAFDEAALLRIATARGRAMADLGASDAGMASIDGEAADVPELLKGTEAVIAAVNAPHQTVVSGTTRALKIVMARAIEQGMRARSLPVAHAFHSPLVAASVPALREALARETFRPLERPFVSTVNGLRLAADEDLAALLCRQVTSPVMFAEAASAIAAESDLLVEVGPGHVLSELLGQITEVPVIALDAGGPSLRGLLTAVGAAFVLGAPVDCPALFEDRFTRPFDLEWRPRFFANPCEQAPIRKDLTPDPAQWSEVGRSDPAVTPATTALQLVTQLVSERAELPQVSVQKDTRLLADLHLNSIVVGQLVVDAARALGLPAPHALIDWSMATIAEVASALEEMRLVVGESVLQPEVAPPGVDTWIRPFTVDLVERGLPAAVVGASTVSAASGPQTAPLGAQWQVIAEPGHPLATRLREMLSREGSGRGVVLCVPPDPDEKHVDLMLAAAHSVLSMREPAQFVVVQQGGGAGSLARTLHLEHPSITTCVVDVPLDHPDAGAWVLAEVKAAAGYSEAHYDANGQRREPQLRLLPSWTGEMWDTSDSNVGLTDADVLLVTGGGKGIAAECAFALAKCTGVMLALLGRARPSEDRELAANLERMADAGIRARYVTADVTDAASVHAAVAAIQCELGQVTALLHGAGNNTPRLLATLTSKDMSATIAPKVQGARTVLAALDATQLKLFVAFGSIIARTGMPGESHYGLANEWLAMLGEHWQRSHPDCRCLVIEWSVWSGTGMGERLGRIDALRRAGIMPISPDEGVVVLRRLLSRPLPCRAAVVVAGRFGDPPTLRIEPPALPFQRFLERPRVHVPGVELVVDAQLSSETDPYLDEHVFEGQRFFPAVIGLEAMAQVAGALVESPEVPVFESVRFDRPIVVRSGTSIVLRVAALARAPGHIELSVRTSETAFQVNHFSGTCVFTHTGPEVLAGHAAPLMDEAAFPVPGDETYVDLPESELYGGLFFQRGRFRRVRGYTHLRAKACIATIGTDTDGSWFGRYCPEALTLGDPGIRDAVMHAIQACIPHAILLPIGVECIRPETLPAIGTWTVMACQRLREGSDVVFDVNLLGTGGRLVEQWTGLRFKTVKMSAGRTSWPTALLGPYIERRIEELLPGATVGVITERTAVPRAPHERNTWQRARSNHALRRLIGFTSRIRRRPDGKPEVIGEPAVAVSTAHAGGLTLAVSGPDSVGCDLEPVVPKGREMWGDLLGPDRMNLALLIANAAQEGEDDSATRVWAASEALKKAGVSSDIPLTLAAPPSDRWVLLRAGPLAVVTGAVADLDMTGVAMVAVLTRSDAWWQGRTSTGTSSVSRTPTSSATSTS